MKDAQRKAMFAKSGSKGHGISSGIRAKDMDGGHLTHDQFVRKASTYFQTHNIQEEEADHLAKKMGERIFR